MAGHSKWANIQHRKGVRDQQRGAGNLDGSGFQAVTYEGYGPGGAAVIVTCMTDNRSRMVADIRNAFAQHGGNLGAKGCVGYLFNEVGLLCFPRGVRAGAVVAAALDAGAEDVITHDDGSLDVLTDPKDFARVKETLERGGLPPEKAEVTLRSSVATTLGEKDATGMVKLLETLEEMDDVQNVYSNADIPVAVLARLV